MHKKLSIAFIIIAAAAVAGCGTLEVGIETTPIPTPIVQPVATTTATASSTPTSTATSVPASLVPTEPAPQPSATSGAVRITFPVGGTTFTFTSKLVAGVQERYVLNIQARQNMSITTGSTVTIKVLDARNNILQPTASSPGVWQGTIPQTGDYTIVLVGQGFVTVTIEIPPPGS